MNTLGVQPALSAYQFFDDDGAPLALGAIVTKLAGTATLQATYADAALNTPNANSLTLASTLTLDAAGRCVMFFKPVDGVTPLSYDVYLYDSAGNLVITYEDVACPVPGSTGNLLAAVVSAGAATTLTIAGGSIAITKNVHLVSPEGGAADNLDNMDVTNFPDGGIVTISNTNGSAAITVRDGVGNIFTGNGQDLVLSATAQRNSFLRHGANLYLIGTPSNLAIGNDMVTGRLTLTTGTPIVAGSTTGSTVYFTPFRGNFIDLYDGSSQWDRVTFTEVSIAVPSQSNKLYDVFGYNNAGVLALELSSAWTNVTTRSQALTLQDGIYVKSGATTRRYLGTFATEASSGVVSDGFTSRCLWNYYNRVRKTVRVIESTATWSYIGADYRQANNVATSQIAAVCGVQEDAVELTVQGQAVLGTAGDQCYVSIGTDSGTLLPATPYVIGQASGEAPAGANVIAVASLVAPAIVGYTTYLWLERGDANGTTVWQGAGGSNLKVQTGMAGTVWG